MYSNILVHYDSITGRLDWKHIGDDVISSSSSITVFGSVITLNAWNHLVVSTCRDLHHRNDVKSFKVGGNHLAYKILIAKNIDKL